MLKKMSKRSVNLLVILVYLVFFSRFFKNSFSCLDPDFGSHLRVGQDIWLKNEIPALNTYNFDFINVPWVDHEWLFDLLIYLIYNYAGYLILTIIFVCFPLVCISLLMKLTEITQPIVLSNSEKVELSFYFYFIAFLGCYASLPCLGIRMQEVTLIFIPLLIICLYRFENNDAQKTLYFLPILFYVWANLHGSFLIGFVILAIWSIVKIVISCLPVNICQNDYFDFGRLYDKKDYINVIGWSLLSFIITFLTPYGVKLYSFLYTYSNTYYLTHVYEWLPFYYSPIFIKQILYTLFYLITLIAYFYRVHRNSRKTAKTSLMLFILSIFFLYMSLKSKRHFILFFITSLPLLAQWLLVILEVNKTKYQYIFSDVIVKKYLFIFLLAASAYFFIPSRITFDPFTSYCNQYPCKAVEYLKSDITCLDKNIFNMYQWGGYLNWMWQGKKIFIDGRFPQAIVNNHTFLEEYHEFFDKEKISKKLDQYNIDVLLLSKDFKPKLSWYENAFANTQALENDKFMEMYNYLKKSKKWLLKYEDDISIVYVKK